MKITGNYSEEISCAVAMQIFVIKCNIYIFKCIIFGISLGKKLSRDALLYRSFFLKKVQKSYF